ncbi:hypothetical protein [Parasphingopyxis sp.]|uniref:hypothetical protein n=1 Tax=Parasphingopyxis sp. TaxID=1920299 RepID=UPI003F9FA035
MTYRAWNIEERFSLRRGLAALVVAPILPSMILALALGAYGMPTEIFVAILMVAEICALTLGIPALLVLRNKVQPRLVWALIYGGFVAAFPWFVISLFPADGLDAWTNGIPTVVDGQLTWFGFQMRMLFVAGIFALGAVGGAVFWFIAVGRARLLIVKGKLRDD